MSSALNKKVLNEIAFSFKLAEGRKPEQTKSIRAPAQHLQYKFSVQNEARSPVGQKSFGNSQDFSKMLSKAKVEPNMLKKRAREPELTKPVQTKKVKQDKLNSIEPEPKTKTKQTPLQSVAVGRDPQPTKQTKTFPPIQAKKIKQGALKDTQPDRKTEKEKVYPNVPVAQVKPKSSKVSKTVHRNEPGALKRPSTSPPLPVQKIKQDEPHPKGKTKQKRQLNVPDGKDKKKSTKAKKNVNTKNNFVPTAKDFSGPRTDADFCCLEEVEDGSPYGEDSDPLFSDDSYSLDSDSIVSHDENVMELGDEQSDSSGIMSDEQFPEICVIDATGQCESVAQLELLSPVTNELGACDDWLHIPDQSSEYIVNHIPIVTETEGEDVQAEQSDASSDISMEDDASVEDLNINESPSSTLTKDLTSSEYIVNHIPIVAETETEDVQAEQSAASSEISMEDDASAEDLNIKETCEDFTYPASGPTIENAIVTISENPADLQLSGLFENSPKANLVLAAIKYDLEIYGSVVVTLLAGNIEVNGFKLRKLLPETIYSPKGFSKVVLSPIPRKKTGKGDINLDQLHDSFSKAQIGNILSNYDEKTDALVLLQRNSGAQKMMNIFSKHIAENLFPHLNILSSSRPIGASEYLLHCLIQIAAKDGGLQVPAQWKKLALKNNSRMMITGGKSVGKSTLLRYVLNRHLTQFPRILLIDLDIGQPEIFVSETVSCTIIDKPLLGPGFFLNKQPDRAFAVGHINIVMCAKQYLRAVSQLLEYCQKNAHFAGIPWLINTMGYNRGFGLELMSLLINHVKPSDVVQIESSKIINNFDSLLDWQTVSNVKRIIYSTNEFSTTAVPKYNLHHLHSAVPSKEESNSKARNMSAQDVRYANLLVRLSAALKGNAECLTNCTPWSVPLDDIKIQHLTSGEYSRSEIIYGMEANIVFLCIKRKEKNELAPECIGIGVVRAIDYEKNRLYIIPAMPIGRLADVNSLVLGGDVTLPQSFFKDQGPDVANSVPFVSIMDDSKSSKSIKQIYFRRH